MKDAEPDIVEKLHAWPARIGDRHIIEIDPFDLTGDVVSARFEIERLREVNADMFQALQEAERRIRVLHGTLQLSDANYLCPVLDKCRAALSKAIGIDTTETE